MLIPKNSLSVFAIVLAALAPPAFSQSIPLEDATFTEYIAEGLRQEVDNAPISIVSPLFLSVGALRLNLGRLYGFCKNNETACPAEAKNYILGVSQVIKAQNAPIEKASIRLVIRSSEYIRKAQASFGNDGPKLQFRPLVEGLVSVAVLDTPRAVRPLDDRDLVKLGISQEQLFEIGSQNLHSSLRQIIEIAKPVMSGQIGTLPRGFYEVGRIAAHEEWEALASAQNGTLLVALPTTDMVLYISTSSPAAIDALRTLAQNIAKKSPNPLSQAVLRWTNNNWELVP